MCGVSGLLNKYKHSSKRFTMKDKQIIIRPQGRYKLIDFKELLDYKDLLFFMVKKEVTVLYKQTVLGLLWAVIRPFFLWWFFQ